ncbi:NADP-reducing hydrogenase subunit HndA [Limihaloglobus sulfuriphilus]|uniref:NADP-reducing hydrogenase subunit HndA n=1 Tax=Limihaloglobus sulfuriphilus TaxID=1851148 RepID=A0A1Q2MF89_9BACT|nr:NAD(P)H-dependent oxidoreductase subunit E [Limihaloglobus sulfuriphilus]AQQ71218.1 NADP-reducing hydrogenase subunit HndA [Limihaloglobus sulfuriphilus]
MTDKINYDELKAFIDTLRDKPYFESYLIAVLHKAQQLYGYISRETMDFVSVEMQIPTANIWGVATFYHFFNLQPSGRYTVSVCMGTACYVKNAAGILDAVKRELGIGVGEVSKDGLFSLQEARCVGACGLAPVIMIENEIYGDLTPESVVEVLNQYRSKAKKESA